MSGRHQIDASVLLAGSRPNSDHGLARVVETGNAKGVMSFHPMIDIFYLPSSQFFTDFLHAPDDVASTLHQTYTLYVS
jgi:hypothetical protein